MADIHNHGLTRSLSGLFQSSKYSDLTVRCGSEEFKLHRAIICPRSTFFAAACDGHFQVNELSNSNLGPRKVQYMLIFLLQEAQTSTIILAEDDPPTVSRMLTYLYTLDYDDEGDAASAQHYMVNGPKVTTSQAPTSEAPTTEATPLSAEELLRHAKMLNNVVVCAIAQKYDIGELKELAKATFRQLLWLNDPDHGLPDIIHAVFETTSATDPGLRQTAVEYCVKFSSNIVADDRLCSMIEDHGELGLDVLREVDKKANTTVQQKELLHTTLVALKAELGHMVNDNICSAWGCPVNRRNLQIQTFLDRIKTLS